MPDDMKTAFERAWERAEKIESSPRAQSELEYRPQGSRLAAAFIRDEGFDLPKAVSEFPADVREHVVEGIQETLLSNVSLPRNDQSRASNKRAMKGIMAIKRDRSKMSQLSSKLDSLLAFYETTVNGAMEKMKKEFEPPARQGMLPDLMAGATPQGEEQRVRQLEIKWHQLMAGLDMDHDGKLKLLKEEIKRLP